MTTLFGFGYEARVNNGHYSCTCGYRGCEHVAALKLMVMRSKIESRAVQRAAAAQTNARTPKTKAPQRSRSV